MAVILNKVAVGWLPSVLTSMYATMVLSRVFYRLALVGVELWMPVVVTNS